MSEMDISIIQKISKPILIKYGITRAAVFGSYARGEQKADSDIDLIINYPSEANIGLLTLVELSYELKSALGKKVDIITENGLSHKLKPQVLKDVKVIL